MFEYLVSNLARFGPAGLLTVVILMVMTGRLVPSSTVRRLQETDQWLVNQLKLSDDTNRAAIVKQLGIIKELAEAARFAHAAVSELKAEQSNRDLQCSADSGCPGATSKKRAAPVAVAKPKPRARTQRRSGRKARRSLRKPVCGGMERMRESC